MYSKVSRLDKMVNESMNLKPYQMAGLEERMN